MKEKRDGRWAWLPLTVPERPVLHSLKQALELALAEEARQEHIRSSGE